MNKEQVKILVVDDSDIIRHSLKIFFSDYNFEVITCLDGLEGIQKAIEQDFHVLVGVIDASNDISIKLHENEGFVLSGVMKEVGYKFGKWLDAAFYQLILKTPEKPIEE